METLQRLSEVDKQKFYESLRNIETQLERLVQRFYYFFLQTEAGVLFKNTEMENHYQMFNVALAFLISHIDNPSMLNKHLELIVKNHKKYGVESKHIPFFIDSFISALKEFFDESDERVIPIWNSIIYEIMSYFNERLLKESDSVTSASYKYTNRIPQGLQ